MPYLVFDEPEEQESSSLNTLARGAGRTLARGTEAIVGLPGNLANLAYTGYKKLGDILPGEETGLPEYNKLPIRLPTSEDVRSGTRALTGNALEPQSSGEQFYDDLISDAAPLLLGPLGLGSKANLGRNLLSSAVGTTAGQTIKGLGGGEFEQGLAKLLFSAGSNYGFRKGQLKDIEKAKYTEFDKLSKDWHLNAGDLKQDIKSSIAKLKKGDLPQKEFMIKRLKSFERNLKQDTNSIAVKDLHDLKKNWNEWFGRIETPRGAERLLKPEINKLNKKLAEFKDISEKGYNALREADDIHGAISRADRATEFIRGVLPSKINNLSPLVKTILGGVGGSLAISPTKTAAGLAALATYRGGERFVKFLSTPTGRKFYNEIFKSAVARDSANLGKSLDKMNRVALQFEKDNNTQQSQKQNGKFIVYD